MKIDFNDKGMTISFDKVPKFLYFNESGNGCGSVFIDGVQIKKIVDVKLHAHTNDLDIHPLEYNVEHYTEENGLHLKKTISCEGAFKHERYEKSRS